MAWRDGVVAWPRPTFPRAWSISIHLATRRSLRRVGTNDVNCAIGWKDLDRLDKSPRAASIAYPDLQQRGPAWHHVPPLSDISTGLPFHSRCIRTTYIHHQPTLSPAKSCSSSMNWRCSVWKADFQTLTRTMRCHPPSDANGLFFWTSPLHQASQDQGPGLSSPR